MSKLILLPLFIYLACLHTAYGKPKRYMQCLGHEESLLHKNNIGGPVYKLNQDIIGSLVQLRGSIYMKKRYVDQVCSAPFPSIKLLELLISKDHPFFSIYTEERTPKMLAVDKTTLVELKHSSAELFVKFTTRIQAGLSKPNCLEKHIPELKEFFKQMQYLQENVGLQKIMDDIKDPKTIFQKLQKLDYKNLKC